MVTNCACVHHACVVNGGLRWREIACSQHYHHADWSIVKRNLYIYHNLPLIFHKLVTVSHNRVVNSHNVAMYTHAYTPQNVGLFQPNVGSEMDKPSCWVWPSNEVKQPCKFLTKQLGLSNAALKYPNILPLNVCRWLTHQKIIKI